MEVYQYDLQEVVFSLLILVGLYFYFTRIIKKNDGGSAAGEVPGALPLIGHLYELSRLAERPHRALAALADKYGPALFIRLGVHRTLVVSNWQVAKECLTVNDKALLSRPNNVAVNHMGYGDAFLGFAPYGPYWVKERKLAVTHLLSVPRVEQLKHIRDHETRMFIHGLYRQCEKQGKRAQVEMKSVFGDTSMNIIMRMVAGKRYSGGDVEARRTQRGLSTFARMVSTFYISGLIPVFGWYDWITGNIAEIKKTTRELDYLFGKFMQEHRERMRAGPIHEKDQDFIYLMLSVLDDGKTSEEDLKTIVKGTAWTMISGASETAIDSLTWALSLLLNHPDVLKKVHDELDAKVGHDRIVDESDTKKLTYLQAVIKETLRLYPGAPIIPRASIEDCTVAGLYVPKGTRVLINLWKIHHDPTVWPDPTAFIPERFLGEKGSKYDFKGHSFEYLPFSSGRKMCPGFSWALHVLHLTLGRLVHAFELRRVRDELVDMSEGPGLTYPKATTVEVIITPRLPAKNYLL